MSLGAAVHRYSAGVGLTALLLAGQAFAQQKVSLSVGSVIVRQVEGQVELLPNSPTQVSSSRAVPGMELGAGDRLKTGEGGWAILELPDQGLIEVQPGTLLEIRQFESGFGEILRLFIGKVRLKIRRLLGRPSHYEMRTPVATIGVRGTELDILVELDRTTTVEVFEGEAIVRDTQRPSEEVVLEAGQKFTVYPRIPPESPDSLGRLVSENFIRESSAQSGLESVLAPAERPTISRFLAFSDPHLDSLENPAYASSLARPSGRFYFFPTRSDSFERVSEFRLVPPMRDVDPEGLFAVDGRYMQGVSARVSYLRPWRGWTLGGSFEHRRVDESFQFNIRRRAPDEGHQPTTEQIGTDLFAPRLDLDARADRSMALVARRVRNQTFALSLDWTDSGGDVQTSYEVKPYGQLRFSESTLARFSNRCLRLVAGYRIETESRGEFAFSYSYGRFNGKTNQTQHRLQGDPADLAGFSTQGQSQEWRLTWRKRLPAGLRLGMQLGLYRSELDESARHSRIPASNTDEDFLLPFVAVGIGGSLWDDRLTYAVDYRFASVDEESIRHQAGSAAMLDQEADYRDDHSLHSWVQLQLPSQFFAGGGMTSLRSLRRFEGEYLADGEGNRTDEQGRRQPAEVYFHASDNFTQMGCSFGRRFGQRYFLEYLVSKTYSHEFSPTSHSLLFRLSF